MKSIDQVSCCNNNYVKALDDQLSSLGYQGNIHYKHRRKVGLYWKSSKFIPEKIQFLELNREDRFFATGVMIAQLRLKGTSTAQAAVFVSVDVMAPLTSEGNYISLDKETSLLLFMDELKRWTASTPVVLCCSMDSSSTSQSVYEAITKKSDFKSIFQAIHGSGSQSPQDPHHIDCVFYKSTAAMHALDLLQHNSESSGGVHMQWPVEVAFELTPAAAAPHMMLKSTPTSASSECKGDASFTFFALGDFGEPNQKMKQVACRMAEWADHYNPKFILSLGDNIYNEGCESPEDMLFNTAWANVFIKPYRPLQVPWKICLGNHDYYGSIDSQINYTKHPNNPMGLWQCPSNRYTFKVDHNGVETAGDATAPLPLVEFFCTDTNG